MGEYDMIDFCRKANVVTGKQFDEWRGYLRLRNQYAHASDTQPTSNQANALIDHLVDALGKL